jgi:hypothetical protein
VVPATTYSGGIRILGGLACGVLLLAPACHRDPNVAYARLLEHAASWAASVQFTAEMARAGNVPPAHVHDVLSTAATDLDALGRDLLNDDGIDAAARTQAADWCRRLTAIVRDADLAHALPDDRQLREIEMRLRDAAHAARAQAPKAAP